MIPKLAATDAARHTFAIVDMAFSSRRTRVSSWRGEYSRVKTRAAHSLHTMREPSNKALKRAECFTPIHGWTAGRDHKTNHQGDEKLGVQWRKHRFINKLLGVIRLTDRNRRLQRVLHGCCANIVAVARLQSKGERSSIVAFRGDR